ncbi:MAG: hypothetical protein AB1473_00755 [Thermodesulfobacteriota bacterium]
MGDYFQIIVDKDATEKEAPVLGPLIRDWLISEGIIESEMKDNVLSSDLGYPPGPDYGRAVEEQDDHLQGLWTNGLDIITERTVFHALPGTVELVCTGCGLRFEPPDEWSEAISEWYDQRGPGNLGCPGCSGVRPITEWQHDPPWGFGYLSFQFWNWPPLTESFIQEVSERLGHTVVFVQGNL